MLRWAVPIAVLAVAALLRFWALGRPGTLVFDELYYVRDAISQLAHGFPTVWPDDEPGMAAGRALAFTDDPSYAVHPPLGKWLIGLGILVFGPDTGWGWRSASALAGVATVGLTMRLGYLLTRSLPIAWLAGLLLALDGVHVTLSRVGLLDGFLTCFVVLGAVLVWRDHEQVRGAGRSARRGDGTSTSTSTSTSEGTGTGTCTSTGRGTGGAIPVIVWRPWLLAAGLAFGAAAAVKWSGLYPLACFLVLITVRDAVVRIRQRSPRPVGRAALQAAVAAVTALPAAAAVYLASWAGWIVRPGGWGRDAGANWFDSLVQYHAEMLAWHGTLSAPHPYQAHPLSWPLALRPTAMYEVDWGAAEGCPWSACVSGITPLPNPLITWAGVAALIALVALVVHAWRHGPARPRPVDPLVMAGSFVVVGYLSGWLPWVLTFSRSAVFQFYAVVMTPFAALALALVLGLLCGFSVRGGPTARSGPAGRGGGPGGAALSSGIGDPSPEALRSRRLSVACFVIVAGLVALLFFPIWSGMPIAEWFWRAHMWLPGWS